MQSTMVGAPSGSHPFTCNTCQVAYRTVDLQKAHMRSDWHRYNLKRKVASLPPITAETFSEKVLQARVATKVEEAKALFEKECEVCSKTYFSENSYANHLSSQKHRANALQRNEVPDDASSVISSAISWGHGTVPSSSASTGGFETDEEYAHVVQGTHDLHLGGQAATQTTESKGTTENDESNEDENESNQKGNRSNESPGAGPEESAEAARKVDPTVCLFCNLSSETVTNNLRHMEVSHGMFLPEKNYLIDTEGLLAHLSRRIHLGNQCLYCGKCKSNNFAVQTHMRDVGHCKIPYETEEDQLDIGDFYDFRSTYSDDEGREADGGEDMEDGMRRVGDDGWETDDSMSSMGSDDISAVPADKEEAQFNRLRKNVHHSRDDPRPHRQADGFHAHTHKPTRAIFHDEYELHLPNGSSVGHRSLQRYYRQNLHSYPTPAERQERLLLEADQQANGMDVDDGAPGSVSSSTAVAVGGGHDGKTHRNRALQPRGAIGLAGTSATDQKELAKMEKRARAVERYTTTKKRFVESSKLNNHKNYYYRFAGGG